ncbi:MAG: 50S ribosomal protein L25 [Acetothermia bacterium 64_32]|nr:MAG: 50S ribosomal protein L25 [Acetothermia bacterium 64_32]HAF70036.1 50S ribosomal protein L25 [Candidatus Acetothermia bacterium]
MIVQAKPRSLSVKARRLRREGYVPGVIYGPQVKTPVHVAIREPDLEDLFKHITRSTTLEVQVEGGETYHVFLKDIQVDPITDRFLHVDFYVPEPGRKLVLPVPVKLVGSAPGVKEGGILEHVHEYIEVEGLPRKIPPYFEVDISRLGLDESILIGDLKWDDDLRPLHPLDDPIVTVLPPKAITLEAGAEEAPEEEGPAVEEGEPEP